jgi:hypothetical protein
MESGAKFGANSGPREHGGMGQFTGETGGKERRIEGKSSVQIGIQLQIVPGSLRCGPQKARLSGPFGFAQGRRDGRSR